ncbi:universal stress protein [Thermococcus waiotapuensis]|uniref:Universal stress protein n=1 Tax=Thermococcus waiotapuensis TaxID=90909 RepID=A0AAE4NUP6_9EURY|nr:universal stress protein [Thermococcus waiotapuensis]MDV3102962.1 universal stress protein [Thermococcus waiotapuensis]
MRILVLVDGSKWSQKAALQAFSIAKRKKAKVILYSVLDRREARAIAVQLSMRRGNIEELQKFEETVWEEMKKSIHEITTALLGVAREEGVNCSIKVREGNAKEEVLREANSGEYTLVVMGAFGKSGKTRIGSLLEEVIGKINPPVIVVR